MPARSKAFQRALDAALDNQAQRQALERTLTRYRQRRAEAFAEVDFAALRADLRRRKEAAIARLPELVEQFQHAAEAVGATVFLARTAEDARRYVAELVQRLGVRLVVKSKSMATEEIRLNEALEHAGARVVETDLGEWIVQLAGERPSHLIGPAIHKSREQIAELFSRVLGRPIPPDPPQLVQVAREELRRAFIEADMGITGANAAIAETGTLVIVTNEGNAELVATLPPVHVAVVGIDKIVPTLDDVPPLLRVLPRAGAAQKLTVRVLFVTGPTRTADIEIQLVRGAHGPRELHIVLLDNGRFAAREDPDLSEALLCIRCGACSNVCPPYQVVSGHLFGHIYTGPIGLPLTAIHHGLEAVADPQSLCVSCNACETVCPVAIPIPRLILDVRARVAEQLGLPFMKRAVLERWSDPARGDRWARLAALAAAPFADRDGFIHSLPFVNGATSERHLLAPARRPLRDQLRHLTPQEALARPAPEPLFAGSKVVGRTVALFPGCLIDRLLPEMGRATVEVLEACGCRVLFPPEQHCCGLVASNAGDRRHALELARQTVEALERIEADWIVTPSTSCYAAIAQDYQHLFRNEPAWRERAARVAERLIDFVRFLDQVAQLGPQEWTRPGPVVTYHDSCQSANALGLRDQPRRLLTEVLDCQIVEMQESSFCCGFGGTFSLDYPRLSAAILERKLRTAAETGAPLIVADNPGCLMQIRGGLHARGNPQRAVHIAELAAERLADLARTLRDPHANVRSHGVDATSQIDVSEPRGIPQ